MIPELPAFLRCRLVADSHDRISWLKARSFGITATDAACLASTRSIRGLIRAKTSPFGFSGNAYTDYGRRREPVIAAWMHERFGLASSTRLFRADGNERHLATPDGLNDDCEPDHVVLAEIKTSTKPIERAPRTYLRQIWWQQYVMGAQRTLLVWEQHRDFQPVGEPRVRWVERDEEQIDMLIRLANQTLEQLDERARAAREPMALALQGDGR